jgi:hypothetical protein
MSSSAQHKNNRVQGQGIRRVKEAVSDVQDTLGTLADNQAMIAGVLVAHEQRHDQTDRDIKMMKARIDQLERERARN